jgi:IS30 family transposase
VADAVVRWLDQAEVGTLFVAKRSPWENGYVESFNGKLRDELLNRKLFLSLDEARWVIDGWRLDYNHHRPHGALEYRTPAAFVAGCVLRGIAGTLDKSQALYAPDHGRNNERRFSYSGWHKDRG